MISPLAPTRSPEKPIPTSMRLVLSIGKTGEKNEDSEADNTFGRRAGRKSEFPPCFRETRCATLVGKAQRSRRLRSRASRGTGWASRPNGEVGHLAERTDNIGKACGGRY